MTRQKIDASKIAALAYLRLSQNELVSTQQLLDEFSQFAEVLPENTDGWFRLGEQEAATELREDTVRECGEQVCEADYVRVPLTVEEAE